MNRIWSFLIALGAIAATVLLLTVKDPYASDAGGSPSAGPAPAIPPPPVSAPLPVPVEEAPPVVPSWFELTRGEGLAFVLAGTVHDSVLKNRLVEAARREAPELVTIVDQMTVDPAARELPKIDHLPDLVAALIRDLREPGLRIEEGFARIEGSGADERMLEAIRGAFGAIVSHQEKPEDRLYFDPERPAPETRMPLVLYLGPLDGKYSFEGSLPSAEQRKAVVAAGVEAVGSEKFADHTRVSPATVDEPWMSSLPALIGGLLHETHGAMELIVVDRTLTLKGELPDEKAKETLLEFAKPAREAGYAVVDALRVKK
jgi:hypothetical protein